MADPEAPARPASARTRVRVLDVTAELVPRFVKSVILSPERQRPLVAVTTSAQTGLPWVDPNRLADRLEGRATVIVLQTGDATWALTDALPKMFDVYGGAVRIWWPGLVETDSPRAHPLFFARDEEEGSRVLHRVVRAIVRPAERLPSRASPFPFREASGAPQPEEDDGGAPQEAEPSAARATVATNGAAGEGVAEPSGDVAPIVLQDRDGAAWQRVAEHYRVGDVVWGLVVNFKSRGVLVELLPHVVGIVQKSEVDWTFVVDPADFVRRGEQVKVQIVELDPVARRAVLSIKRALNRTPLPAITVADGARPFLSDDPEADGTAVRSLETPSDSGRAEHEALRGEVVALREERGRFLQRIQAMQKELRSAIDRSEHLERQLAGDDPTSSDTAFLTAIRVAYARQFSEADRSRYPLGPMRVGSEFLTRLRALDGIAVEKVVEVAMQVAAHRAHEIPGREVHPFGARGGTGVERKADGARAWRCSLQDSTAGARRLHWWQIPGGAIEFASVGVHDDYSMPE